ncbi:enoyl-CoA hydratase-related protein [Desulfoscipio gibsoniae]|uniref:short-chain-enoyl-CoA hydratase n=1 Tax=Desulfoscipio gibsoniae DSM 7213 TaxID=767817 RepID=R4KMR4_9FIRM|nr:enoyl-CoA hydratase-related protein [Desulfoscipio gibsoniae]AGL00921.1 enoyl-CoA hydratase/carnithine racemase [Desulfoscipio gibsoniae DSM 7213]
MPFKTLLFSKQDTIAVITLNRPPMNALNSKVYKELGKVIDELNEDSSVKVVIVTGAGEKAFAAGADITEMVNLSTTEMHEFCLISQDAYNKFEQLNKPTIAAINGLALGGGCELAMTCDFRLASENARFGQPEINLGIIPGGGGTQRLPRLIGLARAKELLYLGDMIDAVTAEKYGLVNKVVKQSELMNEAMAMAKKLASKPAVAMKVLKNTVNNGVEMNITSATNFETNSFLVTFSSEDRLEGMKALLEKRKPNFSDK